MVLTIGRARRRYGRRGMTEVPQLPDYARVASALVAIAARIVASEDAEASHVDSCVLPSVDRGTSCRRVLDRGTSGTTAGLRRVPRARDGDGDHRSGIVGEEPRTARPEASDGD